MGTAAYMSPEQACGQTVDKRADIWAFGCVLFEPLTGQVRSWGRRCPTRSSAVLHRDPDWTALPGGVPPAVTTLLRRCLEKDVRRRRRDIGDVRAELEDALAQPVTAPAHPGGWPPRPAAGCCGDAARPGRGRSWPRSPQWQIDGYLRRIDGRGLSEHAFQTHHRRGRHRGDAGGLPRREGRRVRRAGQR